MSSPLLANLLEAWQFNETGGNRFAAVNGNTLTEYQGNTPKTGNVGRVAGPGGVGFAAHFTAANQANLRSSPASAILDVSAAAAGWHIWCWFKLDSLPAANAYGGLLQKRDGIFGLEYALSVFNNGGTHQLDFRGAPGGEFAILATLDTNWHLAEVWWDPAAGGTMNLAIDHGAPTSEASANVATRQSLLSIGSSGDNGDYLDGAVAPPGIRAQVPSAADRALIWNGGAGTAYPFGSIAGGEYKALLDNTGSGTAVPAGAPLPIWLPGSFSWDNVYWSNGDDITAKDQAGGPLLAWPEIVDRSNKYGRVWVAAPSGGVAAGASAQISLAYGNPAQFSTANYDTLFSKRTADAHTVALFHCDTVTSAATPSTVGGYSLALTAAPTLAGADGGNFRTRSPRQAFPSGGYLTFDGATQYGLAAGLLDTPPAAGCVEGWFQFPTAPGADQVILSKASNGSGSTITDGFTFGTVTASGAPTLNFRVYVGGVLHEAVFELESTWDATWHHFVISWGTKLTLWVDGCVYATAALTGAWGAGTLAGLCAGAKYVTSATAFCNVALDEIEVRNTEPTRAEVLTWLNRGGLPQTWEYDRWTRNPSNPLLVATLAGEQGGVFEPRLLRITAGTWRGVYTGGNSAASLYGMTSTDGLTLTKTGSPVMGHGVGGWAGDACRSYLFVDVDGSLHMFFSDSIPTTGGDIHHATTTDQGVTWTDQGVILAHDAAHPGWANSTVVHANGLYHWLVEYRIVGAYKVAYLQSSSLAGPLTLIDDTLGGLTLKRSANGGYNVGSLSYIAGRFHFYHHASEVGNLPTQIYHAVSDDCRRWNGVGGGDPVIDMADQAILPRQDQVADAFLYALPDSGQVAVLFDIDDNHGGGLASDIVSATRTAVLTDLAVEYPSLSLTLPVPTTPLAPGAVALLL